jgi:hypothetical protein
MRAPPIQFASSRSQPFATMRLTPIDDRQQSLLPDCKTAGNEEDLG